MSYSYTIYFYINLFKLRYFALKVTDSMSEKKGDHVSHASCDAKIPTRDQYLIHMLDNTFSIDKRLWQEDIIVSTC